MPDFLTSFTTLFTDGECYTSLFSLAFPQEWYAIPVAVLVLLASLAGFYKIMRWMHKSYWVPMWIRVFCCCISLCLGLLTLSGIREHDQIPSEINTAVLDWQYDALNTLLAGRGTPRDARYIILKRVHNRMASSLKISQDKLSENGKNNWILLSGPRNKVGMEQIDIASAIFADACKENFDYSFPYDESLWRAQIVSRIYTPDTETMASHLSADMKNHFDAKPGLKYRREPYLYNIPHLTILTQVVVTDVQSLIPDIVEAHTTLLILIGLILYLIGALPVFLNCRHYLKYGDDAVA